MNRLRAPMILAVALAASLPTAPEADAEIRVWQFPQSRLDAASACYRAEREERDIPGERAEYIAWWNEHERTPERADWHEAYMACQDAHLWTHGYMSLEGMVRRG